MQGYDNVLTFAPVTASEIGDVVAWRREVIGEVFGPQGEIEMNTLLAANERYYDETIARGEHLAVFALLGGERVGCGSICFQKELPSPDNPSGESAYLMNIYVRPEYRRRGIARMIVLWLVDQARMRAVDKIYLESTIDAKPLYRSVGFTDLPDMMIYGKPGAPASTMPAAGAIASDDHRGVYGAPYPMTASGAGQNPGASSPTAVLANAGQPNDSGYGAMPGAAWGAQASSAAYGAQPGVAAGVGGQTPGAFGAMPNAYDVRVHESAFSGYGDPAASPPRPQPQNLAGSMTPQGAYSGAPDSTMVMPAVQDGAYPGQPPTRGGAYPGQPLAYPGAAAATGPQTSFLSSGAGPADRPLSSCAIVSFLLSLLSALSAAIPFVTIDEIAETVATLSTVINIVALTFGAIAIICGIVGLVFIAKKRLRGRALAIIGLIIGVAACAVVVTMWIGVASGSPAFDFDVSDFYRLA